MYKICETPHHALQTKYPLHDSKPGVVTCTVELIHPSRERKEDGKRERQRKKDICQLFSKVFSQYFISQLFGSFQTSDLTFRNDLHSLSCSAVVDKALVRNDKNL